jgi:DNA-binding LacI/PurR family transcriptional regulator
MLLELGEDADVNYLVIKKILSSKKPPDAIFASTERNVITSYQVCKDLKIKILNKKQNTE